MRKSIKTAIIALCASVIAFAVSACTISTPTKKTKLEVPVIASAEYNGELQKAVVPENDGYSVTKNNGGTSVGEYDVVLTLTDGKKYEWKTHDEGDESSVTLKFAITQADNEIISLVMEDRNVGEEGKAPVARAKFGVPSFTYSDKANGNFKAEMPTAQGKYFVKATVAETADYKGAEKVVSFRILNPNVATFTTVPAKIDGIVYDSFAHELVTAGTTNDGTVQYKLGANGEWSEKIPTATEAGEYEVFYRIIGDSEHGDYEVEEPIVVTIAENTITEPTANEDLVYNGEEQELVTAGTTKGGTIKYKLGEDGVWSETVPTATDAGQYTVFFKFVNGANETEEKSLSISIAKAQAVIDWQKDGNDYISMDIAYGSEPAKLGVALGTITYKYTKTKIVNGKLEKDGDPADWLLTNGIGTYCCIATVEGTDNYEEAYAERFFTVFKAQAVIDWQKDGNDYISMDVAYGSEPAKLGVANFGTITYKYTKTKIVNGQLTKDGDPADWSLTNGVGTYCCIATVEGADNYEGTTNERFFTVYKSQAVIDWEKDGNDYISMDVAYGSEPAKLGVANFGTITYKYTKTKIVNGQLTKDGDPADWLLTNGIGTYCCIATVEGTDNYEGTTNERFFTVYKTQAVIDWQKDSNGDYISMDIDFGSEPAKLGVTNFGTISYKYTKTKIVNGKLEKDGDPADWLLTNGIGTYCCIATVEGTDNYEGTTNERFFTVRKVTTKNGVKYEFDSASDCYYVSGCDEDIEIANVPATFNNGENGEKTVKYVKAEAFKDKPNLRRVILPASVTELKGLVFFGSANLEYLDMRGVVAISGENNVTFCYNLTTVIVKEGIAINGQQFQSGDASKNGVTTVYVDGTAGITIENEDTNKLIGKIYYKGTADECNVWYVENDEIKTTGDHTFGEDGKCVHCGCYGETLTQGVVYEYDSSSDSYYVVKYSGTLETLNVLGIYNDGKHGEKAVTYVANKAFNENHSIKKVILPESVTTLGGSAFMYCLNLEYVDMRGVTSLYQDNSTAGPDGSTERNNNFLGCTSLKTVVVGKAFNSNVGQFHGTENKPNLYVYGTESDGVPSTGDSEGVIGNIYYYDANGATGCWNYVDDVATLH